MEEKKDIEKDKQNKKTMTMLRKYFLILLGIAGASFVIFYVILIDPLFLFDNSSKRDKKNEVLNMEEKEIFQDGEMLTTENTKDSILDGTVLDSIPIHGEHEMDENKVEYPAEEIYANLRILASWTLAEYKKPFTIAQGYFPIKVFAENIQNLPLSSQEGLGDSNGKKVPTMEVFRLINEYLSVYIDSIIVDNSGANTQKDKLQLLLLLKSTGIQVNRILDTLNNTSPDIMSRLTELAHREFVISNLEKELEQIDEVIRNLIKMGKNEDLSSLAQRKHELTGKMRIEKQLQAENEDLLSFLYTAESMEAFPASMVKEVISIIIDYASSSSPQPFIKELQAVLVNMKNIIDSKKKDFISS